MSMRISSPASALLPALALAIALAGCSSDAAPDPNEPAAGDEHIDCAVGGQADYKPVCSVERSRVDGQLFLTVRHPDGGFRRFAVLTDGRGLAVADGAQEARVTLAGTMLDVVVGTDRYRFPATARGNAAKP